MQWRERFKKRVGDFTGSMVRYPLTTAFLVAASVFVAWEINTDGDYRKYLLTCAVGAVLGATLQALYERFGKRLSARFVLMGCGILLSGGYYLIIKSSPQPDMEINIRTAVALFALLIAYIWVPVIRSRITFNESFMAVFKSIFHALLYAGVIFAGLSLIITAIDQLISPVNQKAYAHVANIVFVLFLPLFFLSLIQVYPGQRDKREDGDSRDKHEVIAKAVGCPKFLEVLISYIIIPLAAIFTVILLIYIVLNISGEFWTNNLLEPMLVSYAIAVILICILASNLTNKFALWFRRIFPKVLIPIVLFQIAASILNMQNTGMTHVRYYVILFGIFAACAGVVLSFLPVRKNGIIAALLIIFAAVSIIPPVDAFTVSRKSQVHVLETVLAANGMLTDNVISPNSSVADADKKKIISSVEYLSMMGYLKKVPWLPSDFNVYEDFYETFGFHEYDVPEITGRYINIFIDRTMPLGVTGYDFLVHTNVQLQPEETNKICTLQNNGNSYNLLRQKAEQWYDIVLTDENGQEMLRFDVGQMFDRYVNYPENKHTVSLDEAKFTEENNKARATLIIQEANLDTRLNDFYADCYILVDFK